jgi:hypothetical protein
VLGKKGIRLMAASTSLLDEPRAYLDGAARVSTPLIEARDTHGSAGYSRKEILFSSFVPVLIDPFFAVRS